jgi:adenine-specific DNA-methyltransferase
MSGSLSFDFELAPPTSVSERDWEALQRVTEAEGLEWMASRPRQELLARGQVFTPAAMARQLMALAERGDVGIHADAADPGAGAGALSVASLARLKQLGGESASLVSFEVDERLHARLGRQVAAAATLFGEGKVAWRIEGDFLTPDGIGHVFRGEVPRPTWLAMNPPYSKLQSGSPVAATLDGLGVRCPNLYAAFLAVGMEWLAEKGTLLAIVPRSFASGRYFAPFRRWLRARAALRHVVVYAGRSNFGKNVLQENVLLAFKKGISQSDTVRITACEDALSPATHDLIVPAGLVLGDLWRFPRSPAHLNALAANARRGRPLLTDQIQCSTGAVEVHRVHETGDGVRILYARDWDASGAFTWGETSKPRVLPVRGLDLPPGKGYVVLKRISSNSDKGRRLQPAWVSRESMGGLMRFGADNHVQYFHAGEDRPLDEATGQRLMGFLRSEEAELCMVATSGTTQVNTDDLAALRWDG